jgi:hypothetical protein
MRLATSELAEVNRSSEGLIMNRLPRVGGKGLCADERREL